MNSARADSFLFAKIIEDQSTGILGAKERGCQGNAAIGYAA
jgi:hypothetical protein